MNDDNIILKNPGENKQPLYDNYVKNNTIYMKQNNTSMDNILINNSDNLLQQEIISMDKPWQKSVEQSISYSPDSTSVAPTDVATAATSVVGPTIIDVPLSTIAFCTVVIDLPFIVADAIAII